MAQPSMAAQRQKLCQGCQAHPRLECPGHRFDAQPAWDRALEAIALRGQLALESWQKLYAAAARPQFYHMQRPVCSCLLPPHCC